MVQKKLEGEEGVDWSVDEMQLLFKGKVLDDSLTVDAAWLEHNARLGVRRKPTGEYTSQNCTISYKVL